MCFFGALLLFEFRVKGVYEFTIQGVEFGSTGLGVRKYLTSSQEALRLVAERTQTFQTPLIKEYALNHIISPTRI